MKSSLVNVALVALLVTGTVSAATLNCTIHPKKGASSAELQKFAKITMDQARAAALVSVGDKTAKVLESELEVEHTCLVYSFDIRLAGKTGVEEVLIDAGDGSVVLHEHESAKQEAAEHATEAAAKTKSAH